MDQTDEEDLGFMTDKTVCDHAATVMGRAQNSLYLCLFSIFSFPCQIWFMAMTSSQFDNFCANGYGSSTTIGMLPH